MRMMMQMLKPCPFCLSERAAPIPANKKSTERLYPIVRCMGCFTDVPGKTDDFSLECTTAVERWNTRPAAPVEGLDTVAEKLARTIWGYFKGGPEAIAWFDNNKSLGGPAWLIEQCRSQAEAIIAAERKRADANFYAALDAIRQCKTHASDNAALTAENVKLKKINAMIMGDDEAALRYTTKRLKQEVERVTQVMRGEASDREAHVKALETQLAAAKKALEIVFKNPRSDSAIREARAALEAKP